KYFSQSVILELKRPAKNLLQTRDQKKQEKSWAKAVYAWTQSYAFLGRITKSLSMECAVFGLWNTLAPKWVAASDKLQAANKLQVHECLSKI
ncbi:MAG TPA: hypothetical protein VGD65_24225, partial [Chryseosolibacter sp.]